MSHRQLLYIELLKIASTYSKDNASLKENFMFLLELMSCAYGIKTSEGIIYGVMD